MGSRNLNAPWRSVSEAANKRRWAGLVLVLVLLSVSAIQARAADGPAPSFEVASVRRSNIHENTSFHLSPNRLAITSYLMLYIIEWAYGRDLGDYGFLQLRDDMVLGGPGWIRGDLGYEAYDIVAKVDDSQAEKFGKDCGRALWHGHCAYRGDMLLMLQSLLANRFKLKVRWETRVGPVYELVVAKHGPKFVPSLPDSSVLAPSSAPSRMPCTSGMDCIDHYLTMAQLASALSQDPEINLPVIDKTGLGGGHIKFQRVRPQAATAVPGGMGKMTSAPPDGPVGTSIFTALREQLGLSLKRTKGPVEYLVIDHIERPSEN